MSCKIGIKRKNVTREAKCELPEENIVYIMCHGKRHMYNQCPRCGKLAQWK